jgi:outer membrane protein TolC
VALCAFLLVPKTATVSARADATPRTPATASAKEKRSLSLADALALADRQNLQLASARTRIDLADESVRAAWSALYPNAAAQGKYTHNYKEFSFALPNANFLIQAKEQVDAVVQLNMPLVVLPAYSALRAAKRSREAARADVEVSRATILLGVAQAFYAAAGTDELLDARAHGLEVAQKTLEDAQQRHRAGAATKVDVSRAEIARVRAEQAVTEAREAHDHAYRALATLLQLREPFQVVPSETVGDAEGRAERPEVISLERNISAIDAQVTAYSWRWAPTISAFGNARVFNYDNFALDRYSWAVGLQLDWIIFDGGIRDSDRRRAQVERHDAEVRLRSTRDQVSDEVADARTALDTKKHALAASTRSRDLASETLELVRTQYQNGTATQLDLLEAQDALVTSEVDVAQARFDLGLADLSLQRATGQFPGRRY